MNDDTLPVPAPRLAFRLIAGRALLLDPTEDRITRFNEVGSYIWEQVARRELSVDELRQAICARFEVDSATALADLQGFLTQLEALGYLVWRSKETATP